LWQQGQRSFNNADMEDIFWAMFQPQRMNASPSLTGPSAAVSIEESSASVPEETSSANESPLATINPKSSVAQIESPDFKQDEDIYVGTCVHSGGWQNSFTYGGKSAKNVSSSMDFSGSTTTIELLDGRTLDIQAKKEGIFINGTLRESRIGTFKLHVLPGNDNFQFVLA
jgi:hypothetical protein